jgi:uncharacterized protein involved in exopolysaccharide biosynthesis
MPKTPKTFHMPTITLSSSGDDNEKLIRELDRMFRYIHTDLTRLEQRLQSIETRVADLEA